MKKNEQDEIIDKMRPPETAPSKQQVFLVWAETGDGQRINCGAYTDQPAAVQHAKRIQTPVEQLGGQAPAQLVNIRNVGLQVMTLRG